MRHLGPVVLAIALATSACASRPVPASGVSGPARGPARASAPVRAARSPDLGSDGPVLGVDLLARSNYPAAEVEADGQRVLSYIKNVLKASAVGIVWNFSAAKDHSNTIQATSATLSARNVGILTRIAEQDHLLVEYRPLIVVTRKVWQNHWEGLISPYNQARWFNNYYRLNLPYLRMAQRFGISEFVAATEMHYLNTSPLWPKFFHRVGLVYHGVTSYSAWDGDYFPPLTHLLSTKYLGMDMYWHMHLRATATLAQVITAFERLFGQLPASVLRRTAIDETGIQARAGAYTDPPALDLPGPRSERVQVNWFTANCAVVRRFHLRGVFFWKVDLTDNPAYPAPSLSTFEGRKGAVAISECSHLFR